jgi:hypothetical protein
MAKKAKTQAPPPPTPELPPKVPGARQELERAIILLGSRAKGLDLQESKRVELILLVGGYPKPLTAANWKRALKSIRDDEIFDCTG